MTTLTIAIPPTTQSELTQGDRYTRSIIELLPMFRYAFGIPISERIVGLIVTETDIQIQVEEDTSL